MHVLFLGLNDKKPPTVTKNSITETKARMYTEKIEIGTTRGNPIKEKRT